MFSFEEGHPNALAPGKRPRTTLISYLICEGGLPIATVGCPGGDDQGQANLQMILNVLVFDMNPQQAVEAPRFATETLIDSFWPHSYRPGVLSVEPGISEPVRDELRALGHEIEVVGACGIGAVVTQFAVRFAGAAPRSPPRRGRQARPHHRQWVGAAVIGENFCRVGRSARPAPAAWLLRADSRCRIRGLLRALESSCAFSSLRPPVYRASAERVAAREHGVSAPAARSKSAPERIGGMGGTTPQPPQNRRALILLGFSAAAANHRKNRRSEPPRQRFQCLGRNDAEPPQPPHHRSSSASSTSRTIRLRSSLGRP
jgi:hypothetical protein